MLTVIHAIVQREIAAAEAATRPKLEESRLIGGQLQGVEGTHVEVGNSTGWALAGLPQQVNRSRAENEKSPLAMTASPPLVDDASE